VEGEVLLVDSSVVEASPDDLAAAVGGVPALSDLADASPP